MIDYGKKRHKIAVFALVIALLALSVGGNVQSSTNTTIINQTVGLNIVVNNTNLAPHVVGEINGTGERIQGVTYFNNNSDIELFVWGHAATTSQTAELHLYINGTKVSDTSGRPVGAAEQSNKTITAIIPRYSAYMIEANNVHHYEWREYLVLSGNFTSSIIDDDSAYLNKSGDSMTGDLNMQGHSILFCENCAAKDDLNNKVNKTGDTVTGNINMSNTNITDTNTLTINNGITLYSPFTASNNETYNFNSCTVGTVPTGWSEDSAHGLFRCVAGGKVNLIHNASDAIASNNYHLAQTVSTDNNFTIQFNITPRIVSDYSYFVFSNAQPITTVAGIYLSIHDNNLYYYDGGWNLVQAVSSNTTYTIKVNNTKVSTGKFDLYVDGTLKGNQINFAGASSTISYIHFGGGGGSNADEYLDDITILVEPVLPSVPWCMRVAYNGTLYTTAGAC